MKVLTIVLTLLLSGCILAPAIKGVQDAGLGPSDRMMKFGEEIKTFQDAVYWGQMAKAQSVAKPEAMTALQEAFKRVGKTERITEVKIDSTKFSDDAYKANVEVAIRYYRVAQLSVMERMDSLTWEYSFADGWKLSALKMGEEGPISSFR